MLTNFLISYLLGLLNIAFPMLLMIFKYAGLLIASISSVIGTIGEATKIVDGRKIITHTGRLSLMAIAIGFFISVVSTVIEDVQQSRAEQQAIRREMERTNKIILSGQPLTSLSFTWTFNQIPSSTRAFLDTCHAELLRRHEHAQGGVGAVQGAEFEKLYELYPFLYSLVSDSAKTGSLITIIPLDNNKTSVLPFGHILNNFSDNWGRKLTPQELNKRQQEHHRIQIPGGIDFSDDLGAISEGYSGEYSYKEVKNYPSLIDYNDSVAIHWNLDPMTFNNCINKQIPEIYPTASIPTRLKILLLYDFEALPFDVDNFSSSPSFTVWEIDPDDSQINETPDSTGVKIQMLSKTMIKLTPNELDFQSLKFVYKNHLFKNVTYRDSGERIPCKALLISYELVEGK